PSSVTTVVIVYRPGPCAWLGVQRITPLASMPAPAGGETNWYVNVLAGTSPSLAALVTTNSVVSSIVRSASNPSVGARFVSFTVTAKLLVALIGGTPSSVTAVLIVCR